MPRIAYPLIITFLLLATQSLADTSWYATTSNNSKGIGVGQIEIRLKDGKACSVSKQQDSSAGRQVVCDRGNEKVQFSVQCGPSRSKDHVQLQFHMPDGTLVDFIEVGCTTSGG